MTWATAKAREFYEAYERLAPSFGYETRKDSAVPWEKISEKNRRLMEAVCEEVCKRWLEEAEARGYNSALDKIEPEAIAAAEARGREETEERLRGLQAEWREAGLAEARGPHASCRLGEECDCFMRGRDAGLREAARLVGKGDRGIAREIRALKSGAAKER